MTLVITKFEFLSSSVLIV